MKTALVETQVATALAAVLTGTPCRPGYDQAEEPGAKQVLVFATAEPLVRNNLGRPVAWTVPVRIVAVTHAVDDANGSVREGLRDAASAWAETVTASGLNVTGYTCQAVLGISDEETTAFGSEFVAAGVRVELVYDKA